MGLMPMVKLCCGQLRRGQMEKFFAQLRVDGRGDGSMRRCASLGPPVSKTWARNSNHAAGLRENLTTSAGICPRLTTSRRPMTRLKVESERPAEVGLASKLNTERQTPLL
jgi:hypothetical protein